MLSKLLPIGLMLGASAGCTTIHVQGATPTVSRYFGFAHVELSSPQSTIAVESKGFGIISTRNAITLGWAKEIMVSAPDASRCQVFVFLNSEEEYRKFQDLLNKSPEKINNICIY